MNSVLYFRCLQVTEECSQLRSQLSDVESESKTAKTQVKTLTKEVNTLQAEVKVRCVSCDVTDTSNVHVHDTLSVDAVYNLL